ncbi:MAG: hypothetical protein KBD78_00690 [Oligoflexales bacterium]|nr:hypothetical protein [Oligoflexales bacterium]
MNFTRIKLSLLLLLLAWMRDDLASAKELRWTHFGPRPLGMGNAFVAVADDYNALFYNPAGIARVKEWTGAFFDLGLEFSSGSLKMASELMDVMGGSGGNETEILDFVQSHFGESHHLSLQWTPHLIFPGIGFGIGFETAMSAVFHRQISAELDFGPRVIMPITYARNFFEERLSVGASIKYVARGGVNNEFSIDTLQALGSKSTEGEESDSPKIEDFIEGGQGVGFDFGVLLTPIKTMEPTVGISIMDIGGTKYKKMSVSGSALAAPEERLPAVNTGISIKPIQTDATYLMVALDSHAINQPEHYSKKFNLGLEWGYGKILKLQTGLHQGELTGGFQFDVRLLKVRFVAYTEQLGTTAGIDETKRDPRFLLDIKLII